MIKLERVSKKYKNGTYALQGVSLNIKKGDFVFFVGPSGAGKSTLVKLLLKEENVTSGKIIVDKKDVTHIHNRRIPFLRRKMGVVFQDFRLLPNKTVYENVAFAMEIIEASHRDIRSQVPMILSIVGLSDKQKSYPSQLSGGEQQRVSIARAIVNNPPILIADEPTGNLDPENSWEIMKLLKSINRRGTTVIMATHDKEIVDIMKQRVVELKKGRILRDEEKGGYGYEG
ncbi:cell division ATP-binding protein FtsE [Helicovermis profundi]|uniref:Cell division ATP-binding protein FtsE n=1 Tax=Helicovermis profundi TaxID=3065157 RepID=A0AAU9E3G6_9FIRM|nr:cell division ATP-binding protein FtsE [Clostridia bacterium S502]